MSHAFLSSRKLLAISGADALLFLQGLFSCDVRPAFSGDRAVYGALLSPQGKFLHDFFLYPHEGGVLLDVDAARADDLFARLKMYRLRSQVVMDFLPENYRVVATWGQEKVQDAWRDPRLNELGFRAVVTSEKYTNDDPQASEDDYHRMRLISEIPDGVRDMVPEKSLLMEFGFEQLGGIDFSKGCYVGQEVTARSKFRGQVRKMIYSVCISSPLPPTGTPITQNNQEMGRLCSVSGTIGLALLQTEAVLAAQTGGASLVAAGVVLDVALPKWLQSEA